MTDRAFAKNLSAHLLRALVVAQARGKRIDLQDLTAMTSLSRADVRRGLALLHRDGFIDVARMRPTLLGFAVGRALRGRKLMPLVQSFARYENAVTHLAAA